MLKVVVALLVATTVAAFSAVIFSLDAVSRASAADNREPSAAAPAPTHDHDHAASQSGGLVSHAGAKPDDAEAIAKAHKPYDATLPPLQAGELVQVHMVMKDKAVEIAPGVTYNVWAFDGDYAAPGPIVHVRQGQTVYVTPGAISTALSFVRMCTCTSSPAWSGGTSRRRACAPSRSPRRHRASRRRG